MIVGKIRQIETMGLVDGPGVRVVIFFQGCSMRCLFCHNPEMWSIEGGEEYTPEKLLQLILKYKPYFKNNGGVTFSGGEPLMQSSFLTECLKLCKSNKIHTCLDTAGAGDLEDYKQLLQYVDLVIYDIKALDNNAYKSMTGLDINTSLRFLEDCQAQNKKLWIRQVIIPGINDNKEYIDNLANYINRISNVERVELLPYHTMGIKKYNELGIKYPLDGISDMDQNRCKELEQYLISLIKKD